MRVVDRIDKYEPCAAARTWLGDRTDIEHAWAECPDGRWMIWLLGRLHVAGLIDRKALVLAACAVARTVLQLVPTGEDRPRIAIETAEAWCRGEATIEQVRAAAADAAYAAAAADAADAVCSVVPASVIVEALAPREG